MFKGSTKLELNEATMIVAVQEYLDKRTKDEYLSTVKSVKYSSNGAAYGVFTIEVEELKASG
jgi:hypothetical protein